MDRVHEHSFFFSAPPPCLPPPGPPLVHSVQLQKNSGRGRHSAADGDVGGGVVRGAAAEAGGGEQAQARGAPAPPPLRRLQRGRRRRRQALAGGSCSCFFLLCLDVSFICFFLFCLDVSFIWFCLIRIGASAGQETEGSGAAGRRRGAAPAVRPRRQPPGEAQVPRARGEFHRIIRRTEDFIFSASFALANKSQIHSSHTKLIQERAFDVFFFLFVPVLDFGRKVRPSEEGMRTDSILPNLEIHL